VAGVGRETLPQGELIKWAQFIIVLVSRCLKVNLNDYKQALLCMPLNLLLKELTALSWETDGYPHSGFRGQWLPSLWLCSDKATDLFPGDELGAHL